MKPLLLGALLAAPPAQAQQQALGPVEGANVVAVLLADSGAVAWKRVVRVLQALGYSLQTRDSITGRIETKARQAAKCFTTVEVILLGHTVLLSGKAMCQSWYYKPRPVWYSAQSHVHFANFDCYAWGWNQLAAIAEELKGKKVVSFRHPRSPN
jgi:hypothetical protein